MKTTITTLAVASAMALSSQAIALEDGTLVVWINGDKGYNGLQEVGNRFEADLGIPVKVEWPDDVAKKFPKEAAIGEGPDIVIWAHDRFGEWAKGGLVAPVEPSKAVMKSLEDQWSAVTFEGAVYGYPITMEGPTLIYNKALVDKAPATFDDIIAMTEDMKAKGVTPITWWADNAYFSYGVLTSEGGYAFATTDSGWDAKDTGINNAGAVAGAEKIRELIVKGALPEGADYGVMDAAFSKGETAMIINGPWSWSGYEKAGIDMGLAPYPAVAGTEGRGFIGVQSAGINAASPNKDLAKEFIENYLLTVEGLTAVNDDKPLGVATHKKFMKQLIASTKKTDRVLADRLKVATQIWSKAEPMPNIPEMNLFWSNVQDAALPAITSGRQSAQDALDQAAKNIVSGVKFEAN